MNQIDPRLQRLFEASARAPRPQPEAIPFGFDTRVLAHWKSELEENGLAPLFRRACLISSAVMLVTLLVSYSNSTSSSSGAEVTLADSAVELSLP